MNTAASHCSSSKRHLHNNEEVPLPCECLLVAEVLKASVVMDYLNTHCHPECIAGISQS